MTGKYVDVQDVLLKQCVGRGIRTGVRSSRRRVGYRVLHHDRDATKLHVDRTVFQPHDVFE